MVSRIQNGSEHHVGAMSLGGCSVRPMMNCDGTKMEPCAFHGDRINDISKGQSPPVQGRTVIVRSH